MSNGKPGVIKDPWRSNTQNARLPAKNNQAVAASAPLVDSTQQDDIDLDTQGHKYASIELKNYGGVVVSGTSSTTQAAAQILKFCVDHSALIERIFLDFGVVVTRLEPGTLDAPFYIQRVDGWTLAVPQAETRDQGCLQLIQALLKLKSSAALSDKLAQYQIKPYKT
jgi:hypothetical protein